MVDIKLFLILLFSLQGLYWFVGRRASRSLATQNDYFLAGKNVRFFPLMMTFLATQIGGGLVLGAADEAYKYGWPIVFYPLGAAIGLILLGLFFGRQFARFPVATIAELLGQVYNSSLIKVLASLLSIVSLFMVLAAQIIASKEFLLALGFNNTPLFILFWAIVILYTAQGGLKAVIATDIIQASVFAIVFLGLLIFALMAVPQQSSFSLSALTISAPATSKIGGWLLMPLLFVIIGQDMGQRCFAGRSPRVVSLASLGAGLMTLVICALPVYLGVLAKEASQAIPQGSSVLMTMVGAISNPFITACTACAVLAALISTASSLINAIGSHVASDFTFSRQGLGWPKIMTTLIATASIFLVFFLSNIVELLIQSYDLCLSCLFVPLIFALFKKKGSFLSALLSLLGGAIGFTLSKMLQISFMGEFLGITLSLLAYLIGEAVFYYRSALTPQERLLATKGK